VVALPAAGAVLRIAGSAGVRSRVPAVVAVARWLEDLRLPAVRLLPGVPQPLEIEGHLVTVWRAVEPASGTGGGEATVEDLAGVLRALHAVGAAPPSAVAPWDVTRGLRSRLTEAAGVPGDDIEFLARELAAVEAGLTALAHVEPLLPAGLLHGDAFVGNLVPSPSGPVLCDFDGVASGPREWDLVPVAVGALRFDYGEDLHRRFVQAYGVDVTAWAGFPALRRLRELQLVTSVLPALEANPALRPQWRLRLDSLRDGAAGVRWSPYPWA
jgi:Ser/Thr protein kinase RdoA (MazF antagonist)